VGTWSRAVAGRIEEAPEQTVVLGHSVGAQAALRALALLGDGVRAAAVLVVAGWQTVDEPWPTIRPWIDTPIDTARARRAVRQIRALLSDDDPFTSDHRATAAWLRDALGATVALAPGGRHFNGAHEHAVEDALVSLLADLG
jgi:predicted alpha/beta hydrolase family esterase